MQHENGLQTKPRCREQMKTILIVDDEVDITETFSGLFELHGFEVLTASNGLQALEVAKKRTPDIIVSDCMMPVMDGLEFSRQARSDPAMGETPIVLMSAAPTPQTLSNGTCEAFIQKPFRFNDLLSVVNRLLKSN